MINVSDRYQCIFVHVPKCAGTSVKHALGLPGRGHPPWNWFASTMPDKWTNYLKFAVVRNPWDRFVSAYVYATMKESYWHGAGKGLHPDWELLSSRSFDECCHLVLHRRHMLRHESWYPQHLWLTDGPTGERRLMVDLVLRYESLSEDLAAARMRLGIESIDLPYLNASPRRDYRAFYDERTRAIVSNLYAEDIALFGYVF